MNNIYKLDPISTFMLTIYGGRHLALGDIDTETLLTVMDVQKHPIESFSFTDFTTSQHGMHLGDVTYEQIEQVGFGSESFWSPSIQAEIDYILSRDAKLFEPSSESNQGTIFVPQPGPAPEAEPVTTSSVFVDADWYLSQNPDVAAAGIDASAHYNQWGWKEGRNPNSLFDTDWYLLNNPDVAAAQINPFDHYNQWGWKEGRDPSSLFDTDWYLLNNPDVAAAQINPLDHYLNYGWQESRNPSERFDTNFYLEQNPDVALAGINPLDHYINSDFFGSVEF